MKRNLVLTAVLWLIALSTSFAGKQDFTLVNRTGFDIARGLRFSPQCKDDWESDVMGKGVLANGASVAIHFAPSDKTKEWDLKVVDGKPVNPSSGKSSI